MHRLLPLLIMAIGAAVPLAAAAAEPAKLAVEKLDGRVRITLRGQVFAEYVFQGHAKPFVYPIFGPDQVPMTRNYPLQKDVPGEPLDHPHHKSIWLAHGDVNGEDFWTEKARIVHDQIAAIDDNPEHVVITAKNLWVARSGRVICTDTTRIDLRELAGGARAIDYDVTIHASHGPITFGDTKEGFMAVRTHPALQLTGDLKRGVVANGHAVNSRGMKDKKIWGERADWVDYWGQIDGKTVGLAMFDHPSNLRHPTHWHARDYGLVAANPFGAGAFAKGKDGIPPGKGQHTLPAGENLRLRYRIVLHRGDAQAAGIVKLYDDYKK